VNKKITDIEVLRGFAVILVCIEHVNINLFFWSSEFQRAFYGWTGMWSGVDLFFVISGFVITRDLLPKLKSTNSRQDFLKVSIRFWIRRTWRLIPSAWLWLLVILIASVFFNKLGAWGSFRANFEGALAAVLNVANLRTWVVFGNFEVGSTFPYWSLSLEEQFYLIFPFLILLSGSRLSAVLGIVVVAQLVFPRTPLGVILRTDALALGVLLAIWANTDSYKLFEPKFLSSISARFLVLGVLAIGLIFVGGDDFNIPLEISLIAYISVLMVFIASYDKDYIWPKGLLKSIATWIGARSYAIYLIHVPAYFATREIWYRYEPEGTVFNGSYTMEFLLTAFILVVIFAELNYRFIEVPLRRKGTEIANNYMMSKVPLKDV
jgi:peptidoglycan/LPS O-acetylase OafA/YrhL